MHDSFTPLAGMSTLLGMMINSFYGGVGVGFLNFYIFIIIAVFICGLMVGRTPEFFGKKIEAREMKIASIIALLHPLLILGGTALSSYLYAHDPDGLRRLVKQSRLIMDFVKCCTSSLPLLPITAVVLKAWAIIRLSGILHAVL